MQPIELRVNSHPAGRFGVVHYTIDKVWPGVANVSVGQRVFISYAEAMAWATRKWPGIPIIRNY